MNPPDRNKPDCSLFVGALWDIDPVTSIQHCSNTVPCMCHRLLRSQVYRALGIAMGYVGHGNQAKFKMPVLEFVRAAFPDGNGIPAGTDVPAMPDAELAAYVGDDAEENPSTEVAQLFVAVLKRLYG